MPQPTNSHQIQAFRVLSRQYSDASIRMHEAIARRAGLSGTDHKYLGLLIEQGALTAGEFSHLTGLTTGAVTGLIDRLEKKQLAKRQFDPQDRRKVIIVPDVPQAMRLLESHFVELQEKTTHLLSSFSETELATLDKYFSASVEIMQEVTTHLNGE